MRIGSKDAAVLLPHRLRFSALSVVAASCAHSRVELYTPNPLERHQMQRKQLTTTNHNKNLFLYYTFTHPASPHTGRQNGNLQ